MKGATTLFSDHRDCESYIDIVLRNAKMLADIKLVVKGDTLEVKANSFLATLVNQGLAVILDEKTAGQFVTDKAYQDALSGINNRTTILLGHTR